jgi:hypothetical protein
MQPDVPQVSSVPEVGANQASATQIGATQLSKTPASILKVGAT